VTPPAILTLIRRGLDGAAALLLLAILAVTAARVVGRYVLGAGMPWSEELTRLLFIWLVLIGAARTRHMAIDLLPSVSRPRIAAGLKLFAAALGIGLLALLVRQALVLVELTAFDRFTALGVSVQYLYWAVVVGGSLWIALTLAGLVWADPDADQTPK
jgi:TRAP-type transport system small permease protein